MTARLLALVRDLLTAPQCWFTGHDGRVEGRAGRLFVRCQRCDRVSPGIQVR